MGVQRVLVVDDDTSIQRVIGFWLLAAGHTVFEAGSAEEALSILDNKPIDVLITDVRLPEMNGVQLAQQAKHTDKPPKVFLMSAFDPPSLAGADGFFRKPDDLPRMLRSV